MQWGQIKTLFILCFLILDIFLARQFIISEEIEPSYIPEFSKEDNLRTNINGLEHAKEVDTNEAMLHVSRKTFDTEDLSSLAQFPSQEIVVINSNTIISNFKEPVSINKNSETEILTPDVLYSDSYEYWGKDETSNTLLYFQTIGKPIYFNQSGLLMVHLNEDGEMIQYVQTMLKKEESQSEEEDLIKPLDAVLTLYDNEKILPGDELTADVRLGYHNLLPLPNGVQVLAPTWEVQVNKEDYYYVNAIEGHNYSRAEVSFVEETVSNLQKTIADSKVLDVKFIGDFEVEDDYLDDLLKKITDKINLINGVETNDNKL